MIVFTKTNDRNALLERTFEPEGKIDGYFNGHDADVFVKYVKEDRRKTADWLAQDQMLTELFSTPASRRPKTLPFKSGGPPPVMRLVSPISTTASFLYTPRLFQIRHILRKRWGKGLFTTSLLTGKK